jgi:hypothetical protein
VTSGYELIDLRLIRPAVCPEAVARLDLAKRSGRLVPGRLGWSRLHIWLQPGHTPARKLDCATASVSAHSGQRAEGTAHGVACTSQSAADRTQLPPGWPSPTATRFGAATHETGEAAA